MSKNTPVSPDANNTREIKTRIPAWLYPSTLEVIDRASEMDNCKSRSEFLEKAALFYAGYVSGQEAIAYLPPALASVLRGTVQDTENHICRLLFKQSVELDMVMNVLAAGMEIPEEQLESLRGRCVQNVKKTSGSVTLDAAGAIPTGRRLSSQRPQIAPVYTKNSSLPFENTLSRSSKIASL